MIAFFLRTPAPGVLVGVAADERLRVRELAFPGRAQEPMACGQGGEMWALSNNRMKLTRGEGGSPRSGAHSRAYRARIVLSTARSVSGCWTDNRGVTLTAG